MGLTPDPSDWIGIPGERRLALLKVAPEVMYGLLATLGERRITQEGLPRDAKVLGVDFDFTDRTFVFTLEHESFESLPHGAPLPLLWPTLTIHATGGVVEPGLYDVGESGPEQVVKGDR